jgi:hypothetical protein
MKGYPSGFGWKGIGALAAVVVSATPGLSQSLPGIPEPGLTLYGEVRNVAGGQNIRMITGRLRWTVKPVSGTAIPVEAQLRNINDQFSYVLRIPYETVLTGFVLSPNALALTQTPTTYDRSATVDDVAAALLAPAASQFTFSAQQRGRLERVDLQVSLVASDRDDDGMPDTWETAFGLNPDNPSDAASDADHDGLTAYAEYRAGTDPNDAQSVFKFIHVQPHQQGGIVVKWSSVEGKTYTLERSTDVLTGYAAIQPSISAVAPENTYHDATATAATTYFYRLRVQ